MTTKRRPAMNLRTYREEDKRLQIILDNLRSAVVTASDNEKQSACGTLEGRD